MNRVYYQCMEQEKKKRTKAFSIRVSQELYDQVAEIAQKEERTINAQIIYSVKKEINAYREGERKRNDNQQTDESAI